MHPNSPARVAIGYVRVSTIDQAREGVSLDVQRARLAQFAAAHDLALDPVIRTDEGISGRRKENRPGLRDAIAAAIERKAVLVVFSLSRFARSTRDCLQLVDELVKGGAGLVSLTESIDTATPHGQFFLTLLAALAQLESDQTSSRLRAIWQFKRSRSEVCSGTPPYGQRIAADGLHVEPDPEEIRTIDRLFELRLSPMSFHDVATQLAREGRLNRAGKPHRPDKLVKLFRRFAPDRGVPLEAPDLPVSRERRIANLVRGRATRAAAIAARPPKTPKQPKPRTMFFPATWPSLASGEQTQTRRRGWMSLRVGDLLLAAEHPTRAGVRARSRFLRVTGLRRERLDQMPADAPAREGLARWTEAELIAHYVQRHGGEASQIVTVIDFEPQ